MAKTLGEFVPSSSGGGEAKSPGSGGGAGNPPKSGRGQENASAPVRTKKDWDSKRAEAAKRTAAVYLGRKRAGKATSLAACCDAAAAEMGYPRPPESSVRRIVPELMTDDERREMERRDARSDLRAEATRRAAEIYREMNGDVPDGEDVVMSVARCCEAATADYGVRPAESSLRYMLRKTVSPVLHLREGRGVRAAAIKRPTEDEIAEDDVLCEAMTNINAFLQRRGMAVKRPKGDGADINACDGQAAEEGQDRIA